MRLSMGRRAPETHDAWVGSLILVGIMAAHAVSETARDALFLTHLPPNACSVSSPPEA